jgi:SSS family solute:Na+ symporter
LTVLSRVTAATLAVLVSASLPAATDDSLHDRALQVLRAALDREQRWIRVHAAEGLLAAGERPAVTAVFDRELASSGSEQPYRIGIWRVLAQAARSADAREPWVQRILAAFLDTDGTDRLHASETLGKLDFHAHGEEMDAFETAAKPGRGALAANARWVLANSGRSQSDVRLAELLQSDDAETRAAAAYAMRHVAKITPAAWGKLFGAAGKEPDGNIVRVSLVAAAFVHAPVDRKAAYKTELLKYARTGTDEARFEACATLAMHGRDDDLPVLAPLLDEKNPDVRVGAANAILQIDRRRVRGR